MEPCRAATTGPSVATHHHRQPSRSENPLGGGGGRHAARRSGAALCTPGRAAARTATARKLQNSSPSVNGAEKSRGLSRSPPLSAAAHTAGSRTFRLGAFPRIT
ncbi:hypothetical protein NDU88_003470 [Pleurodeles waltl]|uniref:Uncharacterized protein n=1 Tax=Pleurodeles waltl TaxID=8319 RepID=A0AAV7VHI6_PLEWA|nr:hypothetical protein NDU88_003470 [Pleurodeles waltl]